MNLIVCMSFPADSSLSLPEPSDSSEAYDDKSCDKPSCVMAIFTMLTLYRHFKIGPILVTRVPLIKLFSLPVSRRLSMKKFPKGGKILLENLILKSEGERVFLRNCPHEDFSKVVYILENGDNYERCPGIMEVTGLTAFPKITRLLQIK